MGSEGGGGQGPGDQGPREEELEPGLLGLRAEGAGNSSFPSLGEEEAGSPHPTSPAPLLTQPASAILLGRQAVPATRPVGSAPAS